MNQCGNRGRDPLDVDVEGTPAEGAPEGCSRKDGVTGGADGPARSKREIHLDSCHHQRVAPGQSPLQRLPVALAHKHLAQLCSCHPAHVTLLSLH